MLSQDPLAAERTVPTPPSVGITAHISICVADIISILLVESIVCNLIETLSPEDQTFF